MGNVIGWGRHARETYPTVPRQDSGITFAAVNAALAQADAPILVNDQPIGNVRIAYQQEIIDNGESGDGPVTIDASAGTIQKLLLTGSPTLIVIPPPGPCWLSIRFTQDGVGGHTVSWWDGIEWANHAEPTLTAAAGGKDIVSLTWDKTSWYGVFASNFGPAP